MAQYRTGTVTVSASQVVTGSGTAWLSAGLLPGDPFIVTPTDGVPYYVASIDTDTQLTLSGSYAGTPGSGLAYVVGGQFTPNLNLPYPERNDIEIASTMKRACLIIDSLGMKTYIDTVGVNDIGTPGAQGFGAGICPTPPPGFAELAGTRDKASDNYGNYLYQDGSVMVWVPLFYYRIAHASNPTYATYLLNSIDIQPESAFADVAAANAAGYALHRAFRDGGATKRGVFVDKYGCSNNAGVASSIRYGKPLSTATDHNPISALNGAPPLTYAGVIDAVKTRGARFFPALMFHRGVLALISNAHGQAASGTTYCAWYDATYNFPKGNNNNALGDTNDAGVLYLSDGYSNCGKCGSGTPFAKTTHNGQACGIADLNGNMWEITLGLTRPGTTATEAINDALGTAKFHILKESVAAASLTSGWNSGMDHWGTDAFLDTNFQEINLAHVGAADGWQYFGNGTNQVFSADLSGNNWLMTGLGIYKDANGASASGTNLFGQDGLYEYHASNLCVLSGGAWANGGVAGVCCANLYNFRSNSYSTVGFRAACYCD